MERTIAQDGIDAGVPVLIPITGVGKMAVAILILDARTIIIKIVISRLTAIVDLIHLTIPMIALIKIHVRRILQMHRNAVEATL